MSFTVRLDHRSDVDKKHLMSFMSLPTIRSWLNYVIKKAIKRSQLGAASVQPALDKPSSRGAEPEGRGGSYRFGGLKPARSSLRSNCMRATSLDTYVGSNSTI